MYVVILFLYYLGQFCIQSRDTYHKCTAWFYAYR